MNRELFSVLLQARAALLGIAGLAALSLGGCVSETKKTSEAPQAAKPSAVANTPAASSPAAPAAASTAHAGVPRDLVVTRVFDAKPQLVWSAWTTSEHMKQWWGPTGFSCPVAEMDVRVGGVSLVCMRAPKEFGGMDYYNTWTYTKVEPHKSLEFVFHFTDKDRNKIQPSSIGLPADMPGEVWQTVTFKAIGKDQTEVTVTEYGYPTDQLVELSKMGLNQCLDKMAASFVKS